MLHGFLRAVEIHQPIIEIHTARRPGADSENSLQKLRTSRSHQTIEAENLALPHIEGNILQMRRELCGQMLHRQNHVSRRIVHRREAVLERASYHGGNQLIHVRILRGLRHNQVAIPEYGNLITDLKNLVHLMRNVNQSDSLLLQHPHHLKELVYLLNRQGGGRLVQNNHLGVVGDCFGDLAHLPL